MTFSLKKNKTKWSFLLLLILLFSSCVTSKSVPDSRNLEQAYTEAIRDASIAEPDEIYKNLTAITPNNPNLVWSGDPGASRLLVATWTDYGGYQNKIGASMKIPIYCWVTIAPQLQAFCKEQNTQGADHLSLRLKQLLGLPPRTEKTMFVELWVFPEDLFRPSPDPEISDHESELDFPESSHFIKISEEYMKWFNNLKSSSYSENGYPWTRLGYSYDWGNPKNEIGLSEFVIRKGATVLINSVSTIDEYCY